MRYIENIKDIWKKLNYILDTTQKKWGVFVLICIMFGAIVETLGVSVIIPLVQAMIQPEMIRESIPFENVRKMLSGMSDIELIFLLGGFVIFIYLIKNIYLFFLSFIRSWYSCKVQKETSVKMMNSYMKRGYEFFLNTNISTLLRGVGGDVSGLYNVLFQSFKIITEGLTACFICIFIMVTDIYMAVAIAGIGLLCVLLIFFLFKGKMMKYGKLYRRYIGITNQNSIQAFEGIKEILVMKREEHFKREYENAYGIMQKANIIQSVASESPAYMIEAGCVTVMIIVICCKIAMSSDIDTMIPQLAAFAVAAFRILPSLGRISSAFNSLLYSIPSLNATYENVYEADRFEVERQNIEAGDHASGDSKLVFKKELKIKNVSWKYSEQGPFILKDVSLCIRKGESIAFVGETGAGKTTLADIVLGLFRPLSGDILIDGKSIYASPKEWAELIGFVPQSVYLTDDTIKKNVAFGIDEKEIDEEKIWHALEQAQLAEFVRALPRQLENIVGDKGVRLSGGQRQRIAIARALYKDPEILVLDEATSALDTETESAVMEAIEYLQGKKTMIIIAHRLSTIENCDVVYEVKGGRVQVKKCLKW